MKVAVDNDILLKGARYGLLEELIQVIPSTPPEISILGAAPYVLRSLLKRIKPALDEKVQMTLEGVFNIAHKLEPTADELHLAAEMEFRAQAAGLSLDTGESILCAIALERGTHLATGDKRAIVAMEKLLEGLEKTANMVGRVICLELLLLRLLIREDPVAIRRAVCADPLADRAVSACFSCAGVGEKPEIWAEGLTSYVAALRREAPQILAS